MYIIANVLFGLSQFRFERKIDQMSESKAIFENEEATRLLNYFITYKEIVNKNENR